MAKKWAYWVSTGLLAAIYLAGGSYYASDISGVQKIFLSLGYPAYLVPILAVLKPAAAIVVLWRFSVALSDFAYGRCSFTCRLQSLRTYTPDIRA